MDSNSTPVPEPDDSAAWKRLNRAGFAVFAALGWWLVATELPVVRITHWAHAGIYLSLLVDFVLLIIAMAMLTRPTLPLRTRHYVVGAIIAMFQIVGTAFASHPPSDQLMLIPKLALGICIGKILAGLVEELWWVPVCAVAFSLADAWSVFASHGVTHNLLEHHKQVVSVGTIALPQIGFPLTQGGALGIVDIAIASWFLAVAGIWKLPHVRLCVAIVIGCLAAFVVAIEWVHGRAVPATPFIAVAALLVHANYYWRDAMGSRRATNSA